MTRLWYLDDGQIHDGPPTAKIRTATCPAWCPPGSCVDDHGERFHSIVTAIATDTVSHEEARVELHRNDTADGPGEPVVGISYARYPGDVCDAEVCLPVAEARQYALAILSACATAEVGV